MITPGVATSPRSDLEHQWGNATLEVFRAERAYAELVSREMDDDETIAAAWLRLWQAQERQRKLSWELDQLEL
jgi:hypothetical protein